MARTASATDGRGGVGGRVTAAQRAALTRKYRLLATWRRSRDARAGEIVVGAPPADRAALRALSLEFPGALRELDVLGLPEIERRIARLTRPERTARTARTARSTSSTRPARSSLDAIDEDAVIVDEDDWIPWILAYHALMRAALVIKGKTGRARSVASAASEDVLRLASAAAGFVVDPSFVRAAARPPGGRLAVVVFAALATWFDVPAARIATTLFPVRRPSPYRL